jgi:hypothetical protein
MVRYPLLCGTQCEVGFVDLMLSFRTGKEHSAVPLACCTAGPTKNDTGNTSAATSIIPSWSTTVGISCSAPRLPRLAASNFRKSASGRARVILYQSHFRCAMISAAITTSRARSTVDSNARRAFRLRFTRRSGTGLPS